MVLPLAKVRDKVFAYLGPQVLAQIAVETFPLAQFIKRHQRNREQDIFLFLCLAFRGFLDFGFHPFALYAVRGENQQQLFMQADGLVDLLVEFLSGLAMVRGKPAAHSLVLQVSMESLSKWLIFGGVADKAGIKLECWSNEGVHVFNKVVGNARAPQKLKRNLAPGKIDGANGYFRRPEV